MNDQLFCMFTILNKILHISESIKIIFDQRGEISSLNERNTVKFHRLLRGEGIYYSFLLKEWIVNYDSLNVQNLRKLF